MIGGLNYIADSYREMACPAVGANTLVRLVFAFSFPLFGMSSACEMNSTELTLLHQRHACTLSLESRGQILRWPSLRSSSHRFQYSCSSLVISSNEQERFLPRMRKTKSMVNNRGNLEAEAVRVHTGYAESDVELLCRFIYREGGQSAFSESDWSLKKRLRAEQHQPSMTTLSSGFRPQHSKCLMIMNFLIPSRDPVSCYNVLACKGQTRSDKSLQRSLDGESSSEMTSSPMEALCCVPMWTKTTHVYDALFTVAFRWIRTIELKGDMLTCPSLRESSLCASCRAGCDNPSILCAMLDMRGKVGFRGIYTYDW